MPLADLKFFLENPCKPDIIGVNYYVTSERYLDEHTDAYPSETIGGNGGESYADTEAVKIGCCRGLENLMIEMWARYRIALAVTECHLHCTREEQMRWIDEQWKACCSLHSKGIRIAGFTIWSLFGAFNWNSLLTRNDNFYENGAYDLRYGKPVPTAIVTQIKALAKTGKFANPLLNEKGWWHNEQHKSVNKNYSNGSQQAKANRDRQSILILGKGPSMENYRNCCRTRAINVAFESPEHSELNRLNDLIDRHLPWAVICLMEPDLLMEDASDTDGRGAESPMSLGSIAATCALFGVKFGAIIQDVDSGSLHAANSRSSRQMKRSAGESSTNISIHKLNGLYKTENLLTLIPGENLRTAHGRQDVFSLLVDMLIDKLEGSWLVSSKVVHLKTVKDETPVLS